MSKNTRPSKYFLYENAVQTPAEHLHFFSLCGQQYMNRRPYFLREDFCGTFLLSSEWVKHGPKFQALGLDIDPEPLAYGDKHHYAPLSSDQKKRLKILPRDVMSVVKPKADITAACNFSFYCLKTEELLYRYFKSAHDALKDDGILILEMVGGAGFIEKIKERKKIKLPGVQYTYVWDQVDFNPIQRHGNYAIHFKLEGEKYGETGHWLKNSFTYDWRNWTIPEVRFWLLQAGFQEAIVYWEEADDKGRSTDIYLPAEKGDNDYTWLCYVVGVKR